MAPNLWDISYRVLQEMILYPAFIETQLRNVTVGCFWCHYAKPLFSTDDEMTHL
jgi:hypothetical protein